jgi:alpha-glucosidase
MTVSTDVRASLLNEPHHDGGELCVVDVPDRLGGDATVRLRVPRALSADDVVLRYTLDGEARVTLARVDEENEIETWWRASFPVGNPRVSYRWLLSGGDAGYRWLNGLGLVGHDVADADDFVLTLDRGGPEWHLRSVGYEIFPDRFASSGLDVDAPGWAVRRAWDELPTPHGPATQYELFGGDLRGIEEHLDHIESLGANVLYLTPIFPSGSVHRYDATTFDRIDPLLGGDDALASLLRAAHAHGIRVVGDLTLNHTGVGHEWFARNERELYLFDEDGGYASWLGIDTLPKLNWQSGEVRRRMGAVARRWLDFGLDGWRIDVANMAGRHGDVDDNATIASLARSWLRDDELLIAEYFHDFRADLNGWHGVMNYAGFTKPVWEWLRGVEVELDSPGLEVPLPRLGGAAAVAAMRAFRAGVPWPVALHSWAMIDSHDLGRFRTVCGSRELHAVGTGLQFTSPGVPMLFAGDELGLEGETGEDARRPMPWAHAERWDTQILATYRQLGALRRSSDALARGGIRYAHADDDVVAYLRETKGERLLCVASRAPHAPLRLPLAAELEPLTGADGTATAIPAEGPSFHVWRLIDG